jgi:hypothetical protein
LLPIERPLREFQIARSLNSHLFAGKIRNVKPKTGPTPASKPQQVVSLRDHAASIRPVLIG